MLFSSKLTMADNGICCVDNCNQPRMPNKKYKDKSNLIYYFKCIVLNISNNIQQTLILHVCKEQREKDQENVHHVIMKLIYILLCVKNIEIS